MAKILLVDDSNTMLKCIKRMLASGGHEVVALSSGRRAVEYLMTSTVDVVLTDLYMPQPDGFEIVQSVRGMPQRPPLIVMSSNAVAVGVFRDAQALGAAAALPKPFTADQLLTLVADVLARHTATSVAPAQAELALRSA
jgi:CheY-like chemotaxis protein